MFQKNFNITNILNQLNKIVILMFCLILMMKKIIKILKKSAAEFCCYDKKIKRFKIAVDKLKKNLKKIVGEINSILNQKTTATCLNKIIIKKTLKLNKKIRNYKPKKWIKNCLLFTIILI